MKSRTVDLAGKMAQVVRMPAPLAASSTEQQFTTVCNSNSRGPNNFFRPQGHPPSVPIPIHRHILEK